MFRNRTTSPLVLKNSSEVIPDQVDFCMPANSTCVKLSLIVARLLVNTNSLIHKFVVRSQSGPNFPQKHCLGVLPYEIVWEFYQTHRDNCIRIVLYLHRSCLRDMWESILYRYRHFVAQKAMWMEEASWSQAWWAPDLKDKWGKR